MGNFEKQVKKAWSGKNSKGVQVNVDIVNNSNTTVTANFVVIITNSEHANSTHFITQHFDSTALGFVEKEDSENTQTGTMQLSSKNTIEGWPEDAINRKNAGKQYVEKMGPGRVATHEIGHIFGMVIIQLRVIL